MCGLLVIPEDCIRVFGCLHKDSVIVPHPDGDKQATPTILAFFMVLVITTVLRSKLWAFVSYIGTVIGALEIFFLCSSDDSNILLYVGNIVEQNSCFRASSLAVHFCHLFLIRRHNFSAF